MGSKNSLRLHAILPPRGPGLTFLEATTWSLSTLKGKMAGQGRILVVNALLRSLPTLVSTFQCCGFLLSVLMMQRFRQRQYLVQICVWRAFSRDTSRPQATGLPHLEVFTWQNKTPAGRVNIVVT